MLVKKLICWSINKKARNLNKIGAIYGYYFDSQPTKLAARKLIILTTRNMSRRILLYTNHYLQKKKTAAILPKPWRNGSEQLFI